MSQSQGDEQRVFAAARALVQEVRECLEAKDFAALPGLTHLDAVVVDGRLTSVEELADVAREKLSEAEDIWLFALRTQRREITTRHALIRVTAYIVWSPEDSWQDQEYEFDLELNLERSPRERWKLVSVEVAPPTPEDVPFPEDPSSSSGPKSYSREAAGGQARGSEA